MLFMTKNSKRSGGNLPVYQVVTTGSVHFTMVSDPRERLQKIIYLYNSVCYRAFGTEKPHYYVGKRIVSEVLQVRKTMRRRKWSRIVTLTSIMLAVYIGYSLLVPYPSETQKDTIEMLRTLLVVTVCSLPGTKNLLNRKIFS